MPRWFKITILLSVSFLIVFIIGGAIFYNLLISTLPKYEGKVPASNISDDIEIYRDSLAIPYIIAKTDEDAAFALGYLHAQERLFSMDLIRRAGEGRMSEVLGSRTLDFDKMFLTAGIKKYAFENVNKIDPEVKKILTAYSRGINLFIKEGNLPVEFDVIGYEPYEWKPEHSIIVIRMMGWQLNISWWSDITFAHLVQKLGEQKVKEILPDFPENAPTIIPPELKKAPPVTTDLVKTDKAFRSFMGFLGSHLGSNNWVVNSNLSASGKPIIANDPHLHYSAPGVWYAAIIRSETWNAEGITLPGVPGIVVGKNQDISWALTNIMVDDCDFYIEKLDSSKTNYLLNGQWKKLQIRKEKIKVKDSMDVVFEVKSTHRGPIVSDTHLASALYPDKGIKPAVLSMKWMGNIFSDELLGFLNINKSKNWDDFKSAVSHFSVPGQNFVYADKQGNIGYVFGTRLPARTSNSPTMVYDGTTDTYDWKGFVPQSEIPVLFNPPSNFIASANNKTLKNFPYHIGNLWEPPSRYERIVQLLTSKKKHSADDYKNYQMDIVSPYAKEITQFIINAFEGKKITDSNLAVSIEMFNDWDYEFGEYSQVPAIYAVFYKHLLSNTYRDEMGDDMFNEFVFMANIPYRSIIQILNNPSTTWFDNILTTGNIETRDIIIRKSLVDALAELEQQFGKDISGWQWGKMHKVVFTHPFGGVSGLLDKVVNIGPYPVGGDGTTLFNTEYPFYEPIEAFPRFNHKEFQNTVGPSMRYIFDFANPDEFYLVLPTGQSGNVMSDHYKDMASMWLEGRYVKIRTDEASMRNNKNKLLKLLKK
ncbi:MAG: penicillin acylase family protein [Ignavibacteriaceae bacterium]